jgi:hypothetical protein
LLSIHETADGIDAASFPAHTRRMAKKSEAKPTAKTPSREIAEAEISLSSGERVGVRADKKLAKPSSLLDTRVVYCGDNLEQLAKLPDACVQLARVLK